MIEKKTEEEARVSRREFLRNAGIGVGGAVIGAAIAYPLAPGKVKEVPKEVPVEVTKEVEVPKYVCAYCGEEFATLSELQAHAEVEHPWKEKKPIPVALYISSIQAKDQLARRVDEFVKRGFTNATVKVDEIEVVGADYLREVADMGFEIALPFAGFEGTVTYEEGLALMSDRKKLFEDCVGKPVVGGSRSRFAYDPHTWDVMEAIGGRWYLTAAKYEKFPNLALEPYKMPGYDSIVRVPMQAVGTWNRDGDVLDPLGKAYGGSF